MERYSIGVTGQIQPGLDPSDVQQKLATLFKCSPDKALSLISGKPVTLKTGLDQKTAERYQLELQKAGAEPSVKKLPAAENLHTASPISQTAEGTSKRGETTVAPSAVEIVPRQPAPTSQQSESATRPVVAPTMECPKCGTRQPSGAICAHCGIVFAKYRGISAAAEKDQQFTFEPPPELEELGNFVGQNFSAYRHKFQKLINNQGNYHFHWHWPAFFITFPWLLYRKMYLFAVLLVLLALTPVPFLGLALPFLCGALGNYLYFRHCRRKLAGMEATGADRFRAIAAAEGTLSMPVTILASFLVMALISYGAFQLIYKDRYFQDQLNLFSNNHPLAAISQVKGEAEKKTLGKMMAIGEFLRIYIAAEKMAGKQTAPPESMEDIQRTIKLKAKDVSDEWGTALTFITDEGKSMLLSAGPDREFSTQDDLSYEVRVFNGK